MALLLLTAPVMVPIIALTIGIREAADYLAHEGRMAVGVIHFVLTGRR